MRSVVGVILLLTISMVPVSLMGEGPGSISIQSEIPSTIDQFIELRDRLAVTPEGGAAVFVVAMNMYVRDNDLGMKAFTLALDRSQLMKSTLGYRGWAPAFKYANLIKSELRRKPYIAPSYIQGTSYLSGYALPDVSKWEIAFTVNRFSTISDTERKLFVKSTGADSPRPVYLRKNNRGIWKVYNDSLILGVRRPEERVDDDL